MVEIYNSYPNAGAGKGDSSVPNFFDRQGTLPALSDLAMYKSRGMTLGGQGSAERVPGFQVTTSFFDLIRTPAYRGRLFLPEDGEVGNNQKAILSHALWQRLFAGRENALAKPKVASRLLVVRRRTHMTTLTARPPEVSRPTVAGLRTRLQDPAYQAFWLLRIGFIVAPILFGLDKFFDVLVDWERYLAPEIQRPHPPGTTRPRCSAVGVIRDRRRPCRGDPPALRGYLVAAWLAGIIFNLLLIGDYYDVALLRDFGLLLAALTLARLATAFPARRPA